MGTDPIQIQVSSQDSPKHSFERRHSGAIDCTGHKLQLERSTPESAFIREVSATSFGGIVQQTRAIVVKAASRWTLFVWDTMLSSLEEDGRFSQDMLSFFQLAQPLSESIITRIHRVQPDLLVLEFQVE
jgi:hypothetical protein